MADILNAMMPENIFAAAASGAMLPVVIFASVFALALTRVADAPRRLIVQFFEGLAAAMMVVVGWVLMLAPLGVFGLAVSLAAQTGAEAIGAPWGVILMFGGGLALAMGMSESGLATWLGQMLLPLRAVPLPVVALVLVGFVVLITEFASNMAAASGIMPVVAALVAALGTDPILLALPAAMAASWGFMLPAGTGPNALAWATGHIAMPRVVRAGLLLDLAGVFLMVGIVWGIAALV